MLVHLNNSFLKKYIHYTCFAYVIFKRICMMEFDYSFITNSKYGKTAKKIQILKLY